MQAGLFTLKIFAVFTLSLLLPSLAMAQAKLSGIVTDAKGAPINGASVSLDNTLDGGTTDSTGHFHFTTTEKGAQTIVATSVGYDAGGQPLTITGDLANIVIHLKQSARMLDNVTITAGAFEASNDKNKAVLTTLDIITTAGANADVVRAIETLPGTQQQGTQTGLFVRGGDASEAAVVVDGLIAQDAFFSSAPGVATRSRFSPFQFKGVSFSSGGYSARYGQALSSILELNTLDFPDKTTVNLGLNMAGIYASGDKLWKNASGSVSAYYNNLTPFYGLAKTNVDFYDVPKGGGASARYVWKPVKDGLLKVLVNGAQYTSGTRVRNPEPASADSLLDYGIKNTNVLSSISYRQLFKDKWSVFAAGAFSYNTDEINAGGLSINNHDSRAQLRIEAKRYFAAKLNVLAGTEIQSFNYYQRIDVPYTMPDSTTHQFTETQIAGFVEAEWSPARWIAIRPGVRYEHSVLLHQDVIAPRISLALRTGIYSQIGLAGGSFYEDPNPNYLLAISRLKMQHALHYIANFQWIKNDRTFRLEGYYKSYRSLILEHGADSFDANPYRTLYTVKLVDNGGYGYAKGIELFWRDKKLIKNLDYWISYSYIDTRRLYQNFTSEVTPPFIADNNLSVVAKYWISKWQVQLDMTYSFATGRPYYNPDPAIAFMAQRTPDYHDLAFTANYLTHIKKWFTVVYAGVDNVTNQHNIFGYEYVDNNTRYPQYPALFRSFFVGVNFSLTEFNKDEL